MLPLFLTRSLFLSRCQAFCSALCVWQSSGFYRGHCVPVVLRSGPMKVRHMRTHKLHLNTLRKDLFCFNKKICDSALSNSCANTCTYTHIVLRIRDRFLCQLFWVLLTYLDCKYVWDIKLLQQNGRRKHIFNFFFFFLNPVHLLWKMKLLEEPWPEKVSLLTFVPTRILLLSLFGLSAQISTALRFFLSHFLFFLITPTKWTACP